jgi:hypothetical protein
MPGGLLFAARAGNRMQARQTYRTINRMERRRAWMQTALEPDDDPLPADLGQEEPPYVRELEHLTTLHERGTLSDEEYQLKKRQVLGI